MRRRPSLHHSAKSLTFVLGWRSHTINWSPFEFYEVLEELIVKLGGLFGPGQLVTASPGVLRFASLIARPAQSFPRTKRGLNWTISLGTSYIIAGAMTLAHRVAPAYQSHRLPVAHVHTTKDFPVNN